MCLLHSVVLSDVLDDVIGVISNYNTDIIIIIIVGFVSTYKDDQQTLQC